MELKTWEDVDDMLKEIALAEVKKAEIEGGLTQEIAKLKQKAKEKAQPIVQRIKELSKAIEAFATSRKEEFAKRRTRELNFGKVGFRIVKSVPVPRDKEKNKALLKSLKAYGLSECIVYEEKPNRDKLVELDDAMLAKLGLQRKVQDKFRVEPYLEKVKEG